MVKTVTPFSTRAKEGATDSPLGDFVEVPQSITSTASAGFFDENGKLTGNNSSDRQFIGFTTDIDVANGAAILTPSDPSATPGIWPLDMAGYSSLFIALKPTRAGNVRIEAVMGDSNFASFGGLDPVDAGGVLRGNTNAWNGSNLSEIGNLILDSADALVADVWNIFYIKDRCAEQKLLQFKITNNSGGVSTIESAFMRLI